MHSIGRNKIKSMHEKKNLTIILTNNLTKCGFMTFMVMYRCHRSTDKRRCVRNLFLKMNKLLDIRILEGIAFHKHVNRQYIDIHRCLHLVRSTSCLQLFNYE